MRVTNLIKEYVEEEVAKAIPITGLYPEYDAMCKLFSETEERFNAEVEALQDKLLETYATLGFPADWMAEKTGRTLFRFSHCASDMDGECHRRRREVEQKRNRAVREILLELELGATKADLARIIAEAVAK